MPPWPRASHARGCTPLSCPCTPTARNFRPYHRRKRLVRKKQSGVSKISAAHGVFVLISHVMNSVQLYAASRFRRLREHKRSPAHRIIFLCVADLRARQCTAASCLASPHQTFPVGRHRTLPRTRDPVFRPLLHVRHSAVHHGREHALLFPTSARSRTRPMRRHGQSRPLRHVLTGRLLPRIEKKLRDIHGDGEPVPVRIENFQTRARGHPLARLFQINSFRPGRNSGVNQFDKSN